MKQLTIAAAQYPIDFLADWAQFEAKLGRLVAEAAAAEAELLVFPEYGAMELASLFPESVYRSLPGQLEAMQTLLPDYLALYRQLAGRYRVHILAASFPVRVEAGHYHNRAHLITPGGAVGFQDKLIMTRFENERWFITAGERVRVFHTAIGRIGIATCYDAEFPLIARAQAEAGADLILAPSCTDSESGYFRVRIGAQARALENQCHVVQAVTVGEAPWSEAVDANIGAAAIYTPVDSGFPVDGIGAIGERNRAGWVVGRADLARARAVRRHGHVLNYRDWPRQRVAETPVETVEL